MLTDERDLARAIARVLDEATVRLLELTSSATARAVVAYEERAGVPAYDDTPGVSPRDQLRVCPCCGKRFWACAQAGQRQRYCSFACRSKHHYWTHPEYRERQIESARARYQRERARRAA